MEINQGYTTMHGQPIIKICRRISSCARWKYEFILESPWLRAGRPQDRGSIPDKGRHFYVRNLWLAQHWRWGFWSSWKTDTKASKERCAFMFMGYGVQEDITTLEDIITTVLRNPAAQHNARQNQNLRTLFPSPQVPHWIWTYSASYPVAIKGFFEVRHLESEARHSSPSG